MVRRKRFYNIEEVDRPNPLGKRDPFSKTHPQIAKEWDYELNCGFTPKQFSHGSAVRVWWRCTRFHFHVWKTAISNRTRQSTGCPECAADNHFGPKNKIPLTVSHPDLAQQFHKTKNVIKPANVSSGSAKVITWQCPIFSDHVWEARISHRTKQRNGCPKCSHWITSADKSLAAVHPELALQWLKEKNEPILPTMVSPGSKKRYWWRCPSGKHEWQQSVKDRSATSFECPRCKLDQHNQSRSSRFVYIEELTSLSEFPGKESLGKKRRLSKEWHTEKNCGWMPKDFSYKSRVKVWWQCSSKHEWCSGINARAIQGANCPFCKKGKPKPRKPNLAIAFPDVARQWHRKLNGKLKPRDISSASVKRVWWQCLKNKDHVWKTAVIHRTRTKTGCPQCFGVTTPRSGKPPKCK